MLRLHTITLSLLILGACGVDDKTTDGTEMTDTSAAASTGADTTAPGTSTGDAEASASGETGVDPTTGPDSTSTSSTSLTTGDASSTGDASTGGPPDGACRGDADCDDGDFELCFAPDETNCGACQVPDAPCADQSECDIGLLCVPFIAPCACDPFAMQCVPLVMCESDGDCQDTEVCDQGACTAKTCDQHMSGCPEFFDCVPDSEPADHCVRHPCAADDECSGGFCVEGRCFEGLGMCSPPAP